MTSLRRVAEAEQELVGASSPQPRSTTSPQTGAVKAGRQTCTRRSLGPPDRRPAALSRLGSVRLILEILPQALLGS